MNRKDRIDMIIAMVVFMIALMVYLMVDQIGITDAIWSYGGAMSALLILMGVFRLYITMFDLSSKEETR